MVSCAATPAINSFSSLSLLLIVPFSFPPLWRSRRKCEVLVVLETASHHSACLAVHFETFKTDAGKRTKFRVYSDGRRWRVTLLIAFRIYGTRGRARGFCYGIAPMHYPVSPESTRSSLPRKGRRSEIRMFITKVQARRDAEFVVLHRVPDFLEIPREF